MHMAVDQAGDHVAAGKVDHRCGGVIGGCGFCMRHDADDALAGDDDVLMRQRRGAGSVDQRDVRVDRPGFGRIGKSGAAVEKRRCQKQRCEGLGESGMHGP